MHPSTKNAKSINKCRGCADAHAALIAPSTVKGNLKFGSVAGKFIQAHYAALTWLSIHDHLGGLYGPVGASSSGNGGWKQHGFERACLIMCAAAY